MIKTLARLAAASALTMSMGAASALTVTATNDIATLTGALLAPASGITILSSNLISGQVSQQGTYTNFNLAPSSGSTPTLTLANGVTLTSGRADIGSSNTINNTSVDTGNGGYGALTTLAGTNTFNANVLEFTFTVGAGINAIALDFLFATEEFPTQSVTDIFGVFVDGINYARFPSGELISNTPGNPTNFILNPVGAGLYATEYNGLTRVFGLVGLLDMSLGTHTLQIGVADTSDRIFDSGVFVANLRATTSTGGGGIGDPGDPNPVPAPASLALVALGLLGIAARRRRPS